MKGEWIVILPDFVMSESGHIHDRIEYKRIMIDMWQFNQLTHQAWQINKLLAELGKKYKYADKVKSANISVKFTRRNKVWINH